MLHEILFALNGNEGNVFTLDNGRFKVNSALPLFHPSETRVLENILELGEKYWRICTFIKSQEIRSESSGLYMEALCEGLDSVLESYRGALRALEKSILFDETIQLSHFSHVLRPFAPVLTALSNLILHIQVQKIKGCYILDIIHKASYSGCVEVEIAMNKLLHVGHKIMYKQLLAWLLHERETEFYAKLAELRECDEFRVCDFEEFVDSVRQTTSRHLHNLRRIIQAFIQVADRYLQSPPNATTKHDTSQAFINAIRSVMNDDESIVKKIQISIDQEANTNISGWSCLTLDYSVPWPLHLIFTPSALDQYNKIFQFLILVKKTQLKLHECWAKEKTVKKTSEHWRLRFHMTFIVDNLQHYLMADVLDSQFSIMWNALDKSEDFEELKATHQDFINSICFYIFYT
ncbi:TUBGCP4 [Lepeophtheirus salmonis]|uniref:Gamma-tubulin complex component n=1 Tax=Lepeophtheirus salmonis TaxID=72036 RepID=A0A7R8CMT0_LEPSM|nr:TUBGCP4 [Lepeophtheirus salmonis]CAF2824132.1 TUBGCP4 [Lepeophtheirus salmonis]